MDDGEHDLYDDGAGGVDYGSGSEGVVGEQHARDGVSPEVGVAVQPPTAIVTSAP